MDWKWGNQKGHQYQGYHSGLLQRNLFNGGMGMSCWWDEKRQREGWSRRVIEIMPARWPRLTYREVSERETCQRCSPANAFVFEDCDPRSASASVLHHISLIMQRLCVKVTLCYFLISQWNTDRQFYIYIYAFSRRFYPKRLTGYTFSLVSVFLGIEPTTFCAADAMLYHWPTQEHNY